MGSWDDTGLVVVPQKFPQLSRGDLAFIYLLLPCASEADQTEWVLSVSVNQV